MQNTIEGRSQHHCKKPHSSMTLLQNAQPLSLDSCQQGAVRVVFSRSQSTLSIKAWDAECFLKDASCSHLILVSGARCLKMHGKWLTAKMQEALFSRRKHFIPVLLLVTFVILSKTVKARAEWNMLSFP